MLPSAYVEALLAGHAAPCLAGIKPSNLVSFPDTSDTWCSAYNVLLNPYDIYVYPLCVCGERSKVLVYRKQLLIEHFLTPEVYKALQSFGYMPELGVEACIKILKLKMQALKEKKASVTCKDVFPHEVGLFLGYPVQDVLQYVAMGGEKCLFCGYWKVYSEPEKARELFDRYSECRDHFVLQMKKGLTISDIIRAA